MKYITPEEMDKLFGKQKRDFLTAMERNLGLKVINIDPAIRLEIALEVMAKQKLAREEKWSRKGISVGPQHSVQPEPKLS